MAAMLLQEGGWWYVAVGMSIYLAAQPRVAEALPPAPYGEYESAFNHLWDRNYPAGAQTAYSVEVQGLAHDDAHWFITQRSEIWKIPVTTDLLTVTESSPHVLKRRITDYPVLADAGYNHFGDLDYYEYNGVGYLVVPVEDCVPVGSPWCDKEHPAIAIFHANDLFLVSYQQVPKDSTDYHNAAFAAVGPNGIIYTNGLETADDLVRLRVNWDQIEDGLELRRLVSQPLWRDSTERETLTFQGGEFSPSRRLLYVVAGAGDEGTIQVFETRTWRLVMESTDYGGGREGPFHYGTHCGWMAYCEAEGVTYWDVNALGAPEIEGELHVLMLDNELGNDRATIFHYTNAIHVDGSYSGPGEWGTPDEPFRTVGAAYDYGWHGSEMVIVSGYYNGSGVWQKQMVVRGRGGSVVIGAEP